MPARLMYSIMDRTVSLSPKSADPNILAIILEERRYTCSLPPYSRSQTRIGMYPSRDRNSSSSAPCVLSSTNLANTMHIGPPNLRDTLCQ